MVIDSNLLSVYELNYEWFLPYMIAIWPSIGKMVTNTIRATTTDRRSAQHQQLSLSNGVRTVLHRKIKIPDVYI
jgi:hypothetical protein